MTRRTAIGTMAGLPALVLASEQEKPFDEKAERERMMQCGLTEAEADCWLAIHHMGVKFFALPKLHPADQQELATAIHVLQDKLLLRPAYRKYLELSKK
jgi:hypothetical protein